MYRYIAEGGGQVAVPKSLNPYRELSVRVNDSRSVVKNAFRRNAKKRSRQDRAISSLAYAMITSAHISRFRKNGNQFRVQEEDVFVLASVGYTSELMKKISKNRSLINAVNEHNHTLLYIAARSGFYDMTKGLLAEGCPINARQKDGSTPLHGASFFGQKEIVQLLLEHGANPTIKNTWGNTAENEAENDEIREVFKTAKEDSISKIEENLRKSSKLTKVIPKYYKGEIVGKELCLVSAYHSAQWEIAWHGTKYKYLESICKYGLKPSGFQLPSGETTETQPGHYELGKTYFGIADWARAIFVSPSVLYAAHICYAERITALNKRWAILVNARVRPSSYTTHDPTTQKKHVPIDGEPDAPEYRIPATEDDKILRISSTPDVVIKSVVLISVEFLDNLEDDMTYEKIKEIFE